MRDEVPSPVVPRYAAELEGSPWLATLDRLYRQKCAEADKLEAEVLKQRVTIKRLQHRIHDMKRRLELWDIRHKTWRDERQELERAAR